MSKTFHRSKRYKGKNKEEIRLLRAESKERRNIQAANGAQVYVVRNKE